jgi:cell division protein FtsB
MEYIEKVALVLHDEVGYSRMNASMSHTPRTSTGRRAKPPRQPGRGRRVLGTVLLAGAALLLVESLIGDRGLTAMLEARRQHQALQQSLNELRARNAALRHQARQLRENPDAIEEAARRDLNFTAPGEKVFIIKDAK